MSCTEEQTSSNRLFEYPHDLRQFITRARTRRRFLWALFVSFGFLFLVIPTEELIIRFGVIVWWLLPVLFERQLRKCENAALTGPSVLVSDASVVFVDANGTVVGEIKRDSLQTQLLCHAAGHGIFAISSSEDSSARFLVTTHINNAKELIRNTFGVTDWPPGDWGG